MREWTRKLTGGILLVSLCMLVLYKPFQLYVKMPVQVTMLEGEVLTLGTAAAVTASAQNPDKRVLASEKADAIQLYAAKPGKDSVVLDIAGFPIKKVNVNVLKDLKIIPGGQSIGVKLNTLGVLVVGHHQVGGENGKVSPGEEAGIKVGDIITAINGTKVEKMSEVAPFVEDAGRSGDALKLTVLRDRQSFEASLQPAQDSKDRIYKLGLYIRDSAAGIGTMTFIEPVSKKYGALGHVISDMDTKKPIVVENGQILESTVTSIEKGSHGNPGEKLARFNPDGGKIGNITKNSPFGIFGTLDKQINNGVLDKPLSIALSHQVKEGPAKILTVVDGEEVQAYDIEIVSTIPQKFPATKGMVIKVTDPKLLKKTGGIVQGMSGSPIIQGNKVIGAVTHVFVNDPTSGYGVHIEWMLNETGIDIYSDQEKAS